MWHWHRLIGIDRDCYSFTFEDNCWPLVNRKVPVHIMHAAFDICCLRPARCWANKPWNSLARPLLGQSTRRPGAAQQGFTDRKRWLDRMKHDQVALFVAFQLVFGTCVIIHLQNLLYQPNKYQIYIYIYILDEILNIAIDCGGQL